MLWYYGHFQNVDELCCVRDERGDHVKCWLEELMHHTRKFLHWPIDSGNYQSEGLRVFVCLYGEIDTVCLYGEIDTVCLYGEIDTVCSNQGSVKETWEYVHHGMMLVLSNSLVYVVHAVGQ